MVSVLGLGTTGWGAHREFGEVDAEGAARQVAIALDGGINAVRHRRDLRRRALRGAAGPGAGRAPRRGRHRHEGLLRGRRRPGRALASAHHARVRREPAAAADRSHRRPPAARLGRHGAAGGDVDGARRARPGGQGPDDRRVQLVRVAPHEGAGDRGARRPGPRHLPADLLLAAGPRRRARAGAVEHRSRRGDLGVEPARRGAPHRQVATRGAATRRHASHARVARPAHLRRGEAVGDDRRPGRRSPRRAGAPCPRSRSPTCCTSPA